MTQHNRGIGWWSARLTAAVLLFGLTACSGGLDQSLQSTQTPLPSYANVHSDVAMVRLEASTNTPELVTAQFRQQLDRAAWPRGIGLVVDDSQDMRYRLVGGLAAQNAGNQVIVSYRWTVLDANGQRLGEVAGEDAVPRIKAASPTPADVGRRITVVRGDTLSKLAREHGVTVADLKAANGLKSNIIRVGQPLRLTKSASTSTGSDPWPSVSVQLLDRIAVAIVAELSRLGANRKS